MVIVIQHHDIPELVHVTQDGELAGQRLSFRILGRRRILRLHRRGLGHIGRLGRDFRLGGFLYGDLLHRRHGGGGLPGFGGLKDVLCRQGGRGQGQGHDQGQKKGKDAFHVSRSFFKVGLLIAGYGRRSRPQPTPWWLRPSAQRPVAAL